MSDQELIEFALKERAAANDRGMVAQLAHYNQKSAEEKAKGNALALVAMAHRHTIVYANEPEFKQLAMDVLAKRIKEYRELTNQEEN